MCDVIVYVIETQQHLINWIVLLSQEHYSCVDILLMHDGAETFELSHLLE